jgi:hypothetical protein
VHRTVRCTRHRIGWTLHLRVSGQPLRYNSPGCLVGHRTVRWVTGLSGVPAEQRLQRNGRLQRTPEKALQCADSSRRVRAAPEDAPDSEQCLSGAAPDCPVPQAVRAPTVETVRTLTVGWRGWRTHRTGLVVEAINIPQPPPLQASKFFRYLI